jgi:hypothetical protein
VISQVDKLIDDPNPAGALILPVTW